MLTKGIIFLFWPWVDATVKAAYNEYQLSEQFNYFLNSHSLKRANQYFHEVVIEEYMNIAFRKHWMQILICPWTVICSNERHFR